MKPIQQNTRTLSVEIPHALARRLIDECQARSIEMSELVEIVLGAYVDHVAPSSGSSNG